MNGTKIRVLLRALFGVALLIWLLRYVDIQQVLISLRTAHPRWIVAGLAAFIAAAFFPCLRLYALFRDTTMSISTATKITWTSYFFNQLLPTGLGGDAYRTVRMKNISRGWISAVGPIVFERMVGAVSLVGPALIYACYRFDASHIAAAARTLSLSRRNAILGIVAMVAIAAALLFLPRIAARRWTNAQQELRRLLERSSASTIASVVALSLAFHATRLVGMNAFLLAVGSVVPWGEILMVMALVMFASLVPVSIGALGVREGLLVYGLGLCGVPAPEAMTVALLNRVTSIAIGAGGLLVATLDARSLDLRADS
jgi:uncharacterized membrane protein YbhN (UPF0104 family)